MRLLFVADGRSPTAQAWIRHFAEAGHDVYLASTFACTLDLPLKGLKFTPVAFSGLKRAEGRLARGPASASGLLTAIRHFLGPLTIHRSGGPLRAWIEQIQPDLVHAMRIPYEGMLAADAYGGPPLLVSIWGNDFTLHAPAGRLMRHYTRWTMQVADGLHADCRRDLRLAREWGFDTKKPALLAPGNGGIRTDIFFPPPEPAATPTVFNPRGFRGYVRNDIFFRAMPLVLARRPETRFICAAMAGEPRALKWVDELGLASAVELLPLLPQARMADVYRRAQVLVSPSLHDGTPNSLLEGMACGCLPVAGDLESIREWITPGENGLLADASDPHNLAEAILEGLGNKSLRERAAGLNRKLVLERAEYASNMVRIEEFYAGMIRNSLSL
jgi:glycosyltransferase involved in cell wall biosynthesis